MKIKTNKYATVARRSPLSEAYNEGALLHLLTAYREEEKRANKEVDAYVTEQNNLPEGPNPSPVEDEPVYRMLNERVRFARRKFQSVYNILKLEIGEFALVTRLLDNAK